MIEPKTMRVAPCLLALGWVACSATPTEALPTPSLDTDVKIASPAPTGSASDGARPDLTTRSKAFAAAYAAMRAGQNAEAREGFARSASELPELADHALYHQAHLALAAGDRDEAKKAIGRLVVEHPDSVWLAAAAVDRGQIALDEGAADEAASWFERAQDAPDDATSQAAKLGLAKARVVQGRLSSAYDLADGLRGKAGSVGGEARTIAESLEARGASALGLGGDDLRLRMARARLREGRSSETREALGPLLQPGQPMRAEAALIEARSFGKASPTEAAAAYEVAINASSSADVAGSALFERGKAAWNRDDDAAADADFRVLLERFPAHPSAAVALAARARIAESRGETTSTIALYDDVATRYPDSRFAADSAWRAAFVRYREGDFSGAARAFAALGERDEARYWQARSLEKSGDREAAEQIYRALRTQSPASYFAWWIDGRVSGGDVRGAYPRANARSQPAAHTVPALSGVAAYHYSRGRILVSLGLKQDALREYAAVEAVSGPDPFLLDAYRDAAAWNALVRTAIRLQQAGTPGIEEAVYPQPYSKEFTEGGRAAGVDPLLLVAMARQESLFDGGATSSAGARGVMQLMPATATRVAGRPVSPESLSDPSFNIDLGARYFDGLLERFDGRIVLAVAAYNAGPEAVNRWLERAGDAPGDEFVERISFRETRDYVKAVLRNYRAYQLLYGDRDLPKPLLY